MEEGAHRRECAHTWGPIHQVVHDGFRNLHSRSCKVCGAREFYGNDCRKNHPGFSSLAEEDKDCTGSKTVRFTAFAMGRHPRLGAGSLVQNLDEDIMRMILDRLSASGS